MKKFKRHRRRVHRDNPQLEMTPMIDVIFLLLIFFIVTLKQEDILAHLDVSRPAPDPDQKKEEVIEDLLQIMVYNQRQFGGQGFALQGKQVSLATIEKHLVRLASFSTSVSVIIKCTGDSSHSNLVRLLDVCAKAGLTNISVFSM